MAELEDTDDAAREVLPTVTKPSHLPLILTLAALLIYFAFQTLQLVSERSNLGLVKSNQEGAMQEAQKIQAQFKTLVGKTSELAEQGHAGAKMVMEELLKRGVSESPQPPSSQPDGKAPAAVLPKAGK